jgi:predicted Zn-dependent protease
MLEKIKNALDKNQDIKAWIIRHDQINSSQQYEHKSGTESIRQVGSEVYSVDVLCDSLDTQGNPSSGLGSVSLLPGGEIDQALEKAVLTAKLVHNQPYDFAEPSPIPTLELIDQEYLKDPAGNLQGVLSSLKDATQDYPHVRLTAAEIFGQEKEIHLVSSKGIDTRQNTTEIYVQWVYIGGTGDEEVETFAEIYRRRITDLKLEEEAALRAKYTSDLLVAGPPVSYSGPIFVKGGTLAVMVAGEMLAGSVIQVLSAASMKYSGETPWEIGKSIFREEVKGDPLQIYANRTLPYGMESRAFDNEGNPARRIPLIRDNKLETYIADQRFASYLDIPATGAFGNLEIPAGLTTKADLQSGSYVEIAEFSWFNPNPITGDFSCEIRLGYVVKNGKKTPFKGGLLVGNLLDGLADIKWSSEVGFFGNYQGPTAARFNHLKIAG